MAENALHAWRLSSRTMPIPTRRLIAASAELDPASRAMLNLWLHRGLSDAQIADFIGATPEGVATRREALVAALSIQLDAAPEEVHETVEELAGRGRDQVASVAAPVEPGAITAEPEERTEPGEEHESAEAEAEPEVSEPVSVPPPQPAGTQAAERTEADGAAPAARHRRRPPRTVLLIIALSLLALILLVSVLLTGSNKSTSAPKTTPSVPPAPRAGPGPGSAAPRHAPASAPRALRLLPVPGGSPRASGVATLSRVGRATRLHLVVRGLTRLPRTAVYAVWLYNSVLDSSPLVLLPRPTSTVDVRLPRRFPRYHFLDVAVQHVPSYFHSGQSVLRAPL